LGTLGFHLADSCHVCGNGGRGGMRLRSGAEKYGHLTRHSLASLTITSCVRPTLRAVFDWSRQSW